MGDTICRTPEEFSSGHVPGAVNIPYMFRIGSGKPSHLSLQRNHLSNFLDPSMFVNLLFAP